MLTYLNFLRRVLVVGLDPFISDLISQPLLSFYWLQLWPLLPSSSLSSPSAPTPSSSSSSSANEQMPLPLSPTLSSDITDELNFTTEPVKAYQPRGFYWVHLATCFIINNTRLSEASAVGHPLLSGLPEKNFTCKRSPFTSFHSSSISFYWSSHANPKPLGILQQEPSFISRKNRNGNSIDNSELSTLSYLNQQGDSNPLSTHVIALLDCTKLQEPNGKHLCVVF